MIRLGLIGDIGSGKSHAAKFFNCPVFNADLEVSKLYKSNRTCYNKIKKALYRNTISYPIRKEELSRAIISNNSNLKKIIKIVHPLIRTRMNKFLKKNRNKKIIVLDIPLLLENKLNRKDDILIYVAAKKKDIYKRLKKRKNFNLKIIKKFKKIQLSLEYKKKTSQFILKNDFTNKTLKKGVKQIIKQIL